VAAKLGCVGSIVTATWFLTVLFANTAPARADAPPTPGIKIYDETSYCTSAFTAQGNDGRYFLMTSGHCDAEGRDYDAIDKTILGFAQPLDDPDGFLVSMEAYAALGIDSVSLMPMTDDPVAWVTRLGDEVVPRVTPIGA